MNKALSLWVLGVSLLLIFILPPVVNLLFFLTTWFGVCLGIYLMYCLLYVHMFKISRRK